MVAFDREKLEQSIRLAGTDDETAREVGDRIHIVEGMSTDDIRKHVYEELRNHDPVAAQRYMRTFRFSACRSNHGQKGVAGVSGNTLHRLRIRVGDTFLLERGGKTFRMTIGEADIPDNEVCIHEEDMERLGIEEGDKVVSKKKDE